MRLPFSADAFFGVLQRYEEAVWPVQVVLVVLALVVVALVLHRRIRHPSPGLDVRLAATRSAAGRLARR